MHIDGWLACRSTPSAVGSQARLLGSGAVRVRWLVVERGSLGAHGEGREHVWQLTKWVPITESPGSKFGTVYTCNKRIDVTDHLPTVVCAQAFEFDVPLCPADVPLVS